MFRRKKKQKDNRRAVVQTTCYFCRQDTYTPVGKPKPSICPHCKIPWIWTWPKET